MTIVARPPWATWLLPIAAFAATGAWVALRREPEPTSPTVERVDIERAVDRGVARVASIAYPEWIDLILADVVRRRFDVAALEPVKPALDAARDGPLGADARVLFRIATPEAVVTPEDLAALTGTVDPFTGPALHCDRIPLPEGYATTLERNAALGEYQLTHVLLAILWIEDNGCDPPYSPVLRARVLEETAKLLKAGDAETTDLELEAAAFLAYLGEARRIPQAFAADVVAAQRPDGGWAVASPYDATNGHSTGFALWYLHELLEPARSEPMVARASSGAR